MFTTSRTRRALVAVSGTALTLSMLTACGAGSSADSPGTQPEEHAEEQAETRTDPDYEGDPWERRLREREDSDREKNHLPYVGDPWEQRLRQQKG